MPKHKKPKVSPKSDGPPPTGYERERIVQARQTGSWLLIRGKPNERQWVLFDAATGRQMGWYSPPSGRYGYGTGRIAGVLADGADAVAMLIRKWRARAVKPA